MSFGALHASYVTLRRRVTVYAGSSAIPEITVEPPRGDNDELSFIRLVLWSYILLHEAARTPLTFLRGLPEMQQVDFPEYVRALRTWTSHNLSLEKERDVKTIFAAIAWFKRTCGAGTPQSETHWKKCFDRLSGEMSSFLAAAVAACDALDSDDNASELVEDFRKRIDRNWDAYHFDAFVEDAAQDLGFQGIDVINFRSRHLDAWRKIVDIASPEEIDKLLRLRIESDILNVMGGALPARARELLRMWKPRAREQLVAALIVIREYRGAVGATPGSLLEEILSKEVGSQSG